MIPAILDGGARVVDFSADYRLNDADVYAQWYGQKHADPQRLGKVVYGLPELFRDQIPPSKLIANPGCYTTSAILALAPAACQEIDRSEDDHRRFEERCFGRGPDAQAHHALSRVQREHFRLQRRTAPPHARDRTDFGHRGEKLR